MLRKNIYLSIGEPWNFVSPDGQNIIKGKLIRAVSNECLVFKADHVINFSEGSGNILILSPRSAKDFSKFLDWAEDYIPVNGLLSINYVENMTEAELKDKSPFVIIGSINSYTKGSFLRRIIFKICKSISGRYGY